MSCTRGCSRTVALAPQTCGVHYGVADPSTFSGLTGLVPNYPAAANYGMRWGFQRCTAPSAGVSCCASPPGEASKRLIVMTWRISACVQCGRKLFQQRHISKDLGL